MAKTPDPFHEFVMELFAQMGPVTIRRMFGGAGVFRDGLMFALIVDDVIYLKADAPLRADLEAEGCVPFVWVRPSDGKQVDLGYVSLPTGAMDEPDLASEWGQKAFAVALATKAKKRK
jgi:DNA transformation protein